MPHAPAPTNTSTSHSQFTKSSSTGRSTAHSPVNQALRGWGPSTPPSLIVVETVRANTLITSTLSSYTLSSYTLSSYTPSSHLLSHNIYLLITQTFPLHLTLQPYPQPSSSFLALALTLFLALALFPYS